VGIAAAGWSRWSSVRKPACEKMIFESRADRFSLRVFDHRARNIHRMHAGTAARASYGKRPRSRTEINQNIAGCLRAGRALDCSAPRHRRSQHGSNRKSRLRPDCRGLFPLARTRRIARIPRALTPGSHSCKIDLHTSQPSTLNHQLSTITCGGEYRRAT
jgi:hypothetical protein